MWEWLWWTGLITFSLPDHRGAVRLRLLPRPDRPRSSARDARLDPLPALPADPRAPTSQARPPALLHEAEVRRPGGHDPPRGAGRRSRRSADGADRPRRPRPEDGDADRDPPLRRRPSPPRRPAGTSALTGQVDPLRRPRRHRRARLRARRADRAARQPEHHLVHRHRGRRLGRGRRRTHPVAAGEAVLWPADDPHAAWTEHSAMRAFVVEFAGPDDADIAGHPGRAGASGSGRGADAGRPRGNGAAGRRPAGRRPGAGRAG